MKKNSFLGGAFIASAAVIITKILGLLYVIPFYSIIGEKGGALYGYAYTIYNLFLIISVAGIPLAISKLTSEYNTLEKDEEKVRMYKLARIIITIFSVISFLICFIFAEPIARLILGTLEGGNTISDVAFVVKIVSFSLLIIPQLSISRGYLQGHKYITVPSISQVIEQIVRIAVLLVGSFLVLKVFNLSLRTGVGVAVFASAIGGLIAYFYLISKMRKNKDKLNTNNNNKECKTTDKEIIKKLIGYAIPFIIINLANTLYNATDMVLILRTLTHLGFTAEQTETISSIFTTWGAKLAIIISSVSSGLVISMIPNIVSSFVKKDIEDVNNKFNKALQILLLIILPLALILFLLASPVWGIFYGNESIYGPAIVKYTFLITFMDCIYMVINSLLQGLNKYKLVFTSVILGLLANLILDVPLMLLFNKMGLYPFYGAILATGVGYTISILIPIINLKKTFKFEYSSTIKIIPKLLLSLCLIILSSFLLNNFITINQTNKGMQIMVIVLYTICFAVIHVIINRKNLWEVLPGPMKEKLSRFKKKH